MIILNNDGVSFAERELFEKTASLGSQQNQGFSASDPKPIATVPNSGQGGGEF